MAGSLTGPEDQVLKSEQTETAYAGKAAEKIFQISKVCKHQFVQGFMPGQRDFDRRENSESLFLKVLELLDFL
jgi:hypothetical protein